MRTLLTGGGIAIAGALIGSACWQRTPSPPFGFTSAKVAEQREAELRFMAMPSADRIRDANKYLADKPHLAGSERDRELAEWTRAEFVKYGLEDIQVITHEVLLPWPEEVSVEMTAPTPWKASMREEPIDGDRYSQISAAEAGIPYHAYSTSGEVTAPVVYAGSGNPADYDAILKRGLEIRGKIALVRYSVPYSYRGFKALTAERRGAAGILIYSDEEDDGALKGAVYPDGPWGRKATSSTAGSRTTSWCRAIR